VRSLRSACFVGGRSIFRRVPIIQDGIGLVAFSRARLMNDWLIEGWLVGSIQDSVQ